MLQYLAMCLWGCPKTRHAGTRNSGIRNKKSGMVKRGTTNPKRWNSEQQIRNGKTQISNSGTIKVGLSIFLRDNWLPNFYLDFRIFQCKSNRILYFTRVEGLLNRHWYQQGSYISLCVFLIFFVYYILIIYIVIIYIYLYIYILYINIYMINIYIYI